MEKRRFGRRGSELPVVGMGTRKTLDVTAPADVQHRRQLVAEALEAGTTVFDTSPMYGAAEALLGRALSDQRNRAFVATKVWARAASEIEPQIRASLDYFGGHIDLYQVHNLVRTEEVLPRLKDLRSTGQVGMIGVTHHDPRALPELARWMETGDIDAVQILYNASRVEVEERILPLASELGLGVLVMEPLGAGMLVAEDAPPGLLERLRAKGISTWAQALLKWVLSDTRVHVVLPATRKAGRPTENARAGEPPWLDAQERAAIRAVFDR